MSDHGASPLRALSEMVETLRQLGIDFSVVGGLAVSVRGEVRTTRDVDIAIAIDQRGLEALVVELRQRGYDVYKIVEHETAGRTATVRLFAPSGVLVDIMAASSGIEADIVAAATYITMESLGPVKVACAEDLLAMKSYRSRRDGPRTPSTRRSCFVPTRISISHGCGCCSNRSASVGTVGARISSANSIR